MKSLRLMVLVDVMVLSATEHVLADDKTCAEMQDHRFRLLGGEPQQCLCDAHRGKLILVVDRDGYLVDSWPSRTEPESPEVVGMIRKYL